MKWAIRDIRAVNASEPADTHYGTQGHWPELDEVSIYNASSHPFTIVHAPCTVHSVGGMPTKITRGSEGTIDPGPAAPWVHRMTACLEAVLACETHIVGVIDAPPDLHIHAALAYVTEHQHLIDSIHKSDSKLMMLTGKEGAQYLEHQGGGVLEYTQAHWRELQGQAKWDWMVETSEPAALRRMEVPLARLLGTYEICTQQRLIHLTYPPGTTVPRCTAPYITYSGCVDSSSARFSSTRGITVVATGQGDVSATVILETQDDDETDETPGMRELRTLLTSSDIAEIGAAFFVLRGMSRSAALDKQTASLATGVIQAIDSKHRAMGTALLPPPMLRQASYSRAHTPWH